MLRGYYISNIQVSAWLDSSSAIPRTPLSPAGSGARDVHYSRFIWVFVCHIRYLSQFSEAECSKKVYVLLKLICRALYVLNQLLRHEKYISGFCAAIHGTALSVLF